MCVCVCMYVYVVRRLKVNKLHWLFDASVAHLQRYNTNARSSYQKKIPNRWFIETCFQSYLPALSCVRPHFRGFIFPYSYISAYYLYHHYRTDHSKNRRAPVSTGDTFKDLPRLRENADNTERYV
jgi:hypothetical protein